MSYKITKVRNPNEKNHLFTVEISSSVVMFRDDETVKESEYELQIPLLIFSKLLESEETLEKWKKTRTERIESSRGITNSCIVCQSKVIEDCDYYYMKDYSNSDSNGFVIHDNCTKELRKEIREFIEDNHEKITANLI